MYVTWNLTGSHVSNRQVSRVVFVWYVRYVTWTQCLCSSFNLKSNLTSSTIKLRGFFRLCTVNTIGFYYLFNCCMFRSIRPSSGRHIFARTYPIRVRLIKVRGVFRLHNVTIVGYFYYLFNCYMFQSIRPSSSINIFAKIYSTTTSVVFRILVNIMNNYIDRFCCCYDVIVSSSARV
jgi:hypothetical protein